MIGIDLFAGAGGMSLGAKSAGIDVQIVIESDKFAAMTYANNLNPKFGVFCDDIKKFNKKLINTKKIPTILFGGPPCQGFSTSNQKTRGPKNEENWLFKEFIRVVKIYMPDWVVFENVKGILETSGGRFVDQILLELSQLGYISNYSTLNAIDYGVPQNRSRFFIVSSKHGIHFEFPKPSQKHAITVNQALKDLPSLKNGASVSYVEYNRPALTKYSKSMRMKLRGSYNHLVSNNNQIVIERYKHIKQGGNWKQIPDHLMTNYTDKSRCHTGIYKRLENDKPSIVIGNYRKNMLVHPTQNRGLSVREAARLQSFPDKYKFYGSIGFQQQQVGNAVPPLLANAIFQKILIMN